MISRKKVSRFADLKFPKMTTKTSSFYSRKFKPLKYPMSDILTARQNWDLPPLMVVNSTA